MKKVILLICAIALAFSSAPLFAEADPNEPMQWTTGKGRNDWTVRHADSENYFAKAPSQLFRGLHNVAFGWGEVISHPIRTTKNAPLVVGTATGLVTGPVTAVLRTGSGLIDVLTFWIPGFNGWGMPKPVLGLSS
jgi:putative exosortase-associated protein (TIGR04073 family)